MAILRQVKLSFYSSATTHLSKQANSLLSGPWLIRGQLYSHSRCIVYSTCVHTTGCTAQSEIEQENWHERQNCWGSYKNLHTSKYVEEVIEVDELNEVLSSAAGEDKYPKSNNI